MKARRLVFLVEEPSIETFLRGVLPNLMPDGCSFECHTFQGKRDLLAKLPNRLRAYGYTDGGQTAGRRRSASYRALRPR